VPLRSRPEHRSIRSRSRADPENSTTQFRASTNAKNSAPHIASRDSARRV
jgi:hypothetical protein